MMARIEELEKEVENLTTELNKLLKALENRGSDPDFHAAQALFEAGLRVEELEGGGFQLAVPSSSPVYGVILDLGEEVLTWVSARWPNIHVNQQVFRFLLDLTEEEILEKAP